MNFMKGCVSKRFLIQPFAATYPTMNPTPKSTFLFHYYLFCLAKGIVEGSGNKCTPALLRIKSIGYDNTATNMREMSPVLSLAKGAAANYKDFTTGERFEVFPILRNVPRKLPTDTNHAILGDGGDDTNLIRRILFGGWNVATGARIPFGPPLLQTR